eukprot:SM000400S15606  [mRNA]  locus=s400:14710:15424:- [translate_table: standard]
MSLRIQRGGSFGLHVAKAPIELLEDDAVEEGRKMRQLLYLTKRTIELCQRIVPKAEALVNLSSKADDPVAASFALAHVLEAPVCS